jgi:hypothetical protein
MENIDGENPLSEDRCWGLLQSQSKEDIMKAYFKPIA